MKRLFSVFIVLIMICNNIVTQISSVDTGSEPLCSSYTTQIFSDVFRYLDEIYIEKYPDLGLRCSYGSQSDKRILADLALIITQGCSTNKEKADAIEGWIQRNIEYSGGSSYPIDTFYNRFGDCQSYAQLMSALLRLVGIPAVWGDGWRGDMDINSPSNIFELFGHAWCYVYIDGEWYLYDPLWFSGGTADRDYMEKWYYSYMVEGVTPVYNTIPPLPHDINRLYINGKFIISEGSNPANTNLVNIVNNLFLHSIIYWHHENGSTIYNLYFDNRDISSMENGECYRNEFLRAIGAGSLSYAYENGILASATVIEFGGKSYYADYQTAHMFEIACSEDDYSLVGGWFSVVCGYEGIPLRVSADSIDECTVVWESSNPSVTKVSNDGYITTLKQGTTFISAHYYDSDGVYLGSGACYCLYVRASEEERIADYSDMVNNHEHCYIQIVRDPTCTEEGYTINTCVYDNCADSYIDVDSYTDSLGGHDTTVCDAKSPTCVTFGWDSYEMCNICEYSTYKKIPMTGHHGGVATCTNKAICESCKKEYGGIAVNHHPEVETRNEVEATETVDGYTGDLYCTKCNKKLSEGEIIPATGIGDVDSNKKINLSDVSLILKYIALWDIDINILAADVTGDDKVNLMDVSLILKYIAGWDVVFVITTNNNP